MMMQGYEQRWKIADQLRLRWRSWQDEYIVYNCNSGDTHLLNPIAAEALKNLQQAPHSIEDLSQVVGDKLDIAVDQTLQQNLHRFVLKLAHLGLVYPADDTR
jgi:PqqD family protein of HPr-rel-A system